MKNKLTKIQKAVMLTHIMRILDGKKIYTEDEVVEMKARIDALEAEVARLEAERPMPDHENIRGKEYYK